MDMVEKDNLGSEKRNEDYLNYPSSKIPSDWQFNENNQTNASIGLISTANPMAVCEGNVLESSSCSGASIVDSFCPTLWDQPTSSQSLGFSDINVQHDAGTSNALGNRASVLGPLRGSVDSIAGVGWTPPNATMKGGMFLPGASGFLPSSLAHFPTDSGFIERAARYSCFNGGNFGDIMNPFSMTEPMDPYSRGLAASIQGSQEAFTGSGLKSISGLQTQENEMNMGESSTFLSLPDEHVASKESPKKNEKTSASLVRSHDEARHCVGPSGNESDEAEFSGRGGQEEFEGAAGEAPSKLLASKKRRRGAQDTELDQNMGISDQAANSAKGHSENQVKGDQNPTSTTTKPGGKNARQGPQASDSPKEEYIHVRARRGQATNSHSLAERVRREKISERMKFLQDLVPGCSKVTGKAVMLDEIINYVQSLQRQVEFLSMKLATVNPRLDFNLEGLLAKDIFQSRAGPSSLTFPSDMTLGYHPLHQPQGTLQTGLHGLGTSADALRRSMNSPLMAMSGPTTHVPNVWEDELHNIVQMGLNAGASTSSQDMSGSLPPGHMKAEL